MKEKIKILIADDHQIVLTGLKFMLSKEKDIEVVGEAENGSEAIEIAKERNPHLALLDIDMPVVNGLKAAKEIKELVPNVKIVFLTALDDFYWVERAVKMAAEGYLVKDVNRAEIGLAIKKIINGERVYSEAILQYLEKGQMEKEQIPIKTISFTKRELDVLNLLAAGKSYSEIADILYISPRTAEAHCYNLKKKTGLAKTAQLIKFAVHKMENI